MDNVQIALRKRYAHIHPLMFHRCLEKANTNGELFDLLEEMPVECPIVWDTSEKKWKHTTDLLQQILVKE